MHKPVSAKQVPFDTAGPSHVATSSYDFKPSPPPKKTFIQPTTIVIYQLLQCISGLHKKC